MKTINFNFNEFNLQEFIKDYNEKIRIVFGINDHEPIGRILEVLEHNTFDVRFVQNPYSIEDIKNLIEAEEIALFMPLGSVGDNKSKYLRLINMIQYRVELGDVEEVYKNTDKFKTSENILDLGDLKISNDSSIGIVISKIDKKLFISFAQYECGSCMHRPILKVKENTGDLAGEIKKYLYKYSK